MNVNVAIVDDQLPIPIGKDTHGLNNAGLAALLSLSLDDWHSQTSLKTLIDKLLSYSPPSGGVLNISGFKHPAIILKEIESKGYRPDVVVFDWEYAPHFPPESQLLDILSKTGADIFVYSSYFDAIPPELDKSDFDEFAKRIHLLEKGDKHSSVFSSEEYIVQYIMSRFSADNVIFIDKKEVKFMPSEYLKVPSDILYLESAFGTEFLKSALEDIGPEISKESIERLFENITDKLYLSNGNKYILAENNELLSSKYGPLSPISYLEALRSVGIKGIDTVLSSGICSKEGDNAVAN